MVYRVVVFVSLIASAALATAPRVFVASNGMDTGACGRSAPCRSFSYAMTQVSVNGEVVALDTAGYGSFTISQSVAVYAAPGATAAVLATSGTAIDISAGTNDTVILKNLYVNGSGSSTYGILFSSGRTLRIENCDIANFPTLGSMGLFASTEADGALATIIIDHSTFEQNGSGCSISMSGNNAIAHVVVRNSTFSNNLNAGMFCGDGVRAAITDSTFVENGGVALIVAADSPSSANVNAERCTMSGNNEGALAGNGTGPAMLRLAYCMVTDNFFGLNQLTNGTIAGRTDGANNNTNTVEDNGTGNTVPTTYPAK
jgi:hypothetical protein